MRSDFDSIQREQLVPTQHVVDGIPIKWIVIDVDLQQSLGTQVIDRIDCESVYRVIECLGFCQHLIHRVVGGEAAYKMKKQGDWCDWSALCLI